jgi:thymidylate kinase
MSFMSTRHALHAVVPMDLPERPFPHFVVEFAGTPRAGKTSAMLALQKLLEARHHQVKIIEEHASIYQSRRHPYFNIWTATKTTSVMLEAMQSTADVVLIDRGLFDALCWMDWYHRSGHLSRPEHRVIVEFLCVRPLRQMIHLALVMTVEPAVALQREREAHSAGVARGPRTIMNAKTLCNLNRSIAATVDRHRAEFALLELDTTAINQERVLEMVGKAVRRRMPDPEPSFHLGHDGRDDPSGPCTDVLDTSVDQCQAGYLAGAG